MCNASEFAVGAVLGQKDGKHFHPIYFASKTLNAAQQKYTVIEKELMALQDLKPRLIRWILLLQEFNIEIKDKKGIENVAANHLSWIENDETSDNDDEINDNFPGETLMEISTRDIPWFTDFANYLVGDIMPKGMTYQQKNKFFSDLKNYFWEDPYLFKVYSYGMIRRCISGPETCTILDQCHHRPTGGHYGPTTTAKKVLNSCFYWPTIIKEAHTLVRLCKACQKTRNISKRDEMPLDSIQVCKVFDIWGIEFMGPFPKSYKFEYILVAVNKIQKMNIKFRGGLFGLKDFKMILRVTTAQLRNRSRIGVNKWYQSFALRNFDLEVMEFESSHSNTTAKLPILKLVPVTAEEKTNKKNDVKARSLLLMALSNEQQLTFSQYTDAKTMFAAIKTRFEGNEATKKTQKTLLKQQYENFSASSSESLNSIFNRLQKINTHVVVWMNKAEIETMSIDDLYNNFKIVEKSVKKSVGASSGAQNLDFMTPPSTSSTNDVNTAIPAYEVSTASPNVNAASPQDFEQIHGDDLEAIDLKWRFSLLSMRAKRYYQRTGKKIFINANDTTGYDKSKVECFNRHKMGHCARECRAPRNKDGQSRNQDNTRKHGNNEDTSSKAMLAIDGVGFVGVTWQKNSEFEKVKQEKDGIEFKIEKFDKASKDLDNLLWSQITDKSKKGLGYNVVPPPHPLIYNRPKKLDMSYSGLDEFKAYGSEAHCTYHQRERVVYGNNYNRVNYNYTTKRTHPNAHKNMVPRAVLMKTGLKPFNTAKIVNTAHPKSTVFSAKPMPHFSKTAQSTVRRPFQLKTVLTNKRFTQKVNIAKAQVVNIARLKAIKTARPNSAVVNAVRVNQANAVKASACWVWRPTKPDSASITLKKHNYIDARGRSKHITGNITYLSDFKEFDGGYVTFGGGAHSGRISGKGTLKTDSLDFEDLPDETQILLKIPRKDNMYSFDMKNIVPKESLTCLVAKATSDESMLWHRRLGHINFKNINKLVKDNLVKGLPTKHYENDQTCVACLKAKQHRASYKFKVLNPITKPFFMLHMDLFGLTFMSSLMHKKYCLVVIDDYSRFTWVFFLASKDETSEILKNFTKEIENLVDKKVKIIRCDNGIEFKNKVIDDFCREKGIKREYSVAMTPQQNGVAERRNKTLTEAARTMLADSKLPTTFWAEAVSTVCYVHNKFKFDGKSDEGFFVGCSLSSKAFRVYNTRTRRVEENLHIGFLENKPMIEGNGPKWLFDIDSLTQSMNYVPITAGTITNESADASYFDSPSKDVDNGEPKSAADEKDKYEDNKSPKEVNIAGQHVNTADKCTDMSKITRKSSKTGKHGHEKRKSTREAKDSKLKPEKIKLQSFMGQQKIEEFLTLVSRAHLTNEEFEASELSDTRITSSYSTALSDSTTLLSPDHPLTKTIPTHMLSRPLYYHRTARIAVRTEPTLSPGFSARLTEAMTLSPSSFHTETKDDESEAEGTSSRSEESEDEGPDSEGEEAALEGQQ
ncbi:putative ribonuclease H-like domain-containing protein [Tanacetum coccineum]